MRDWFSSVIPEQVPNAVWRAAAFVAVWTLLAFAFAGQLYVTQLKLDHPVSWSFALERSFADWMTFAALSVPALWLAWKFPLAGERWPEITTLHTFGAVVFALAWVLLRAAAAAAWEGRPFREALRYALAATVAFNALVYGVLVMAASAASLYRSLRQREWRAIELERRLTEARLLALQAQLNPHFLFNALHGVSALMYRDVDAADRTLSQLSQLLREALERPAEHLAPLREELDFLDRYLTLEAVRFGPRLTVVREVDPSALDAPAPPWILQPLVENALKHGVEPRPGPGVIALRARFTTPGRLRLEVEDSGPGLPPAREGRAGIGVANCRQRLAELFGDAASLSLSSGALGGVLAAVELPVAKPFVPRKKEEAS